MSFTFAGPGDNQNRLEFFEEKLRIIKVRRAGLRLLFRGLPRKLRDHSELIRGVTKRN